MADVAVKKKRPVRELNVKEPVNNQLKKENGKKPFFFYLFIVFIALLILSLSFCLYILFARGNYSVTIESILENKPFLAIQDSELEQQKKKLLADIESFENRKKTDQANIDSRNAELEKLEEQLKRQKLEQDTIALQQKAKDDQITRVEAELSVIVAIYEKMDAKNAAKILEKWTDIDKIAIVIKNIKTDQAAAILAAMDSTVATKVSEKLLP